jgi:hypothetical protein
MFFSACLWCCEQVYKAVPVLSVHMIKNTRLAHLLKRCCAQAYKAVPALSVHMVKKTSKSGPGRLHILRIIEAIVGKSLQKHRQLDKYGERLCICNNCPCSFQACRPPHVSTSGSLHPTFRHTLTAHMTS